MTFLNVRYLLADVGGPSFLLFHIFTFSRIRQCAEKLPADSELDVPFQHKRY
jgi:hypothetical protein